MKPPPAEKKPQDDSPPPMPFDDVLRKILKAPPQHKTAKRKKK
jgi:hypothetical protein